MGNPFAPGWGKKNFFPPDRPVGTGKTLGWLEGAESLPSWAIHFPSYEVWKITKGRV